MSFSISSHGLSHTSWPDLGHRPSTLGDDIYSPIAPTARLDDFPATPKESVGYSLPHTPSGDAALSAFMTADHLNRYDALFFGKIGFGDHSIHQLSQFLTSDHRVKHLILPHNGIGDGAVMSEFAKAGLADLLKVNHTIGWLILNGNLISSLGAKALAIALRVNKGVKHVVLSDNQIGDEGVIELAQLLTYTTTIESLFIQGNPFGCQGVKALISVLPRCKSLKILDIRDCHCQDMALKKYLVDLGQRLGIRVKA
jgi:hypothetical protein